MKKTKPSHSSQSFRARERTNRELSQRPIPLLQRRVVWRRKSQYLILQPAFIRGARRYHLCDDFGTTRLRALELRFPEWSEINSASIGGGSRPSRFTRDSGWRSGRKHEGLCRQYRLHRPDSGAVLRGKCNPGLVPFPSGILLASEAIGISSRESRTDTSEEWRLENSTPRPSDWVFLTTTRRSSRPS